MGRPRRLSTTFLAEERAKLDRYRKDVRLVQQSKVLHSDTQRWIARVGRSLLTKGTNHQTPVHSLEDGPFVYQVPEPLNVGQHITGTWTRIQFVRQSPHTARLMLFCSRAPSDWRPSHGLHPDSRCGSGHLPCAV